MEFSARQTRTDPEYIDVYQNHSSLSMPERNIPFTDEQVPSYESSQLLHANSSSMIHRYHSSSTLGAGTLNTNESSTSSSIIGRSLTPPTTNTAITASEHTSSTTNAKNSLKKLGFRFLNARQHFALACCRDISLLPCLVGLFQSWRNLLFHANPHTIINGRHFESLTGARTSEHFLTGIWCIVAGCLSYSILDGLMVRWVVTYSTSAAIVRMLSMSTIMVTIEQYLVSTFSANGYSYGLHIWILISCILTITFIIQNFITSNLDLHDGKKRARFFDFYNIAVFAVVPVGIASFITMIGVLRSLLILRLDIEHSLQKSSVE